MAESLRRQAQNIANAVLQPAGLHLQRVDRAFDMDGMLRRAKSRGFAPATVIDIGASDGIWSIGAQRVFPGVKFLLFEPLEERRLALEHLRNTLGFDHVAAAAGSERGQVSFGIDPGLDGSGVAAAGSASTRSVPVETIDHAVAERKLSGPFCIKLDTHGYEVPVLTGAEHTLRRTELLIIEAYNFQLTPGCLRFHELCAWLEQRGFRCCDLADPMRRPSDGVLWQMDLAFAKATDAMFSREGYR